VSQKRSHFFISMITRSNVDRFLATFATCHRPSICRLLSVCRL